MTTTPAADRSDAALDQAVAAVTVELARTDQKAALLLALDGGLSVAAATAAVGGSGLPAPACATAAMAGLALVTSVVLLLLTVRPHLRAGDGAFFPDWAGLTPEGFSLLCARTAAPTGSPLSPAWPCASTSGCGRPST